MAIRKSPRFKDRQDAGALLAQQLSAYAGRQDAVVLALPRGGVPVGIAIAERLKIAFDVLLVRKLGYPGHRELAMGAVASGGMRVLQQDVLDAFHVPAALIEEETAHELREIARREQRYRLGRPATPLAGRVAILCDDGVATGATMRAAIQLVHQAGPRQAGPARVVLAVPVCAREACAELRALVDECVCLKTPEPFLAVGAWYQDFEQVSDEEVEAMLAAIWGRT